MKGRSHLVLGLVVGAAGVLPAIVRGGAAADGADVGLVLGLTALGALLPDLDHERALVVRVVRRVPPLRLVAWLLSRSSRWHNGSRSHRGWHHSWAGLLLWAIPAAWLWPGAGFPLALGYLSHLLADATTRDGIPWLWPHRRRLRLLPGLRSDSRFEPLVAGVLCALTILGGFALAAIPA